MTQQIIPWNGDHFIDAEMERLITTRGIKTVIETGTWSGHSTRRFRQLLPLPSQVITIDPTDEHLIEEFGPGAIDDLKANQIRFILGDSIDVLPKLVRQVATPVLFYLDGHGGGKNPCNVNPILEELEIIGGEQRLRDRCVICIHDVRVPGKNFGYNGGDWGRGFESLSYELFKPRLEKIFTKGHAYHHNEKAAGATRGILYCYPKL